MRAGVLVRVGDAGRRARRGGHRTMVRIAAPIRRDRVPDQRRCVSYLRLRDLSLAEVPAPCLAPPRRYVTPSTRAGCAT